MDRQDWGFLLLVGTTLGAVGWVGWDFIVYLGREHWGFLLVLFALFVCIVFPQRRLDGSALSALLRRSRS